MRLYVCVSCMCIWWLPHVSVAQNLQNVILCQKLNPKNVTTNFSSLRMSEAFKGQTDRQTDRYLRTVAGAPKNVHIHAH